MELNVYLRALLCIIPVPVFLCYALALGGCVSSSPGVPNLYTIKLYECMNTTTELATCYNMRVGIYGMCGGTGSDTACFVTRYGEYSDRLASLFAETTDGASVQRETIASLVTVGLNLQSKSLPSLLVAAAILFTLGFSFFLLWVFVSKVNQRNKAKAGSWSTFFRRATLILLWVSVALALVSTVTLAQGVGAFQTTLASGQDVQLRASPGIALQILEWLTFAFSMLMALGVQILVRRSGSSPPLKPAPAPSAPPPAGPSRAPAKP